MSTGEEEEVPYAFKGVFMDKFGVADCIKKFLEYSPDENAQYLLPRFDWLLQVWNTNRDYEYPSLEEYDPDSDEEETVESEA